MSCILRADSHIHFSGMGMLPNRGRGRGGFNNGQMGGQGHFNPAFMQSQQGVGGGGQFDADGPRKRYRMDQGS